MYHGLNHVNMMFVFSGPLGCGKSTIINTLCDWYDEIGLNIKAHDIVPTFDVKTRNLKGECQRCVKNKNKNNNNILVRESSSKASKARNELFQHMGGAHRMDLPKKWFGSYVWVTDAEKRMNYSEIDYKSSIIVKLFETVDIGYRFPNGGKETNRVYLHVISLDPREIGESFRYFVEMLQNRPNDDDFLTSRFVIYTKVDKYAPTYDDQPKLEKELISHIARDAKSLGVPEEYIPLLNFGYKIVSCAKDELKYDGELGVLSLFFYLVGTLLAKNAKKNNTMAKRHVLNEYDDDDDDDAADDDDDEEEENEDGGEGQKLLRNTSSTKEKRNRKDEGCCYQ